MADIKAALGSSFSSFMPSKKKKEEQDTSPKRENPATFLKIIAKNFMSIHLMARDLNVARQNVQKLVQLEGGKPAKGADAFFLKASEREAKLETEMAKEQKKPEPEKPQPKKKGFFAKLMDQFNVTNIIKSFQKYFMIAGIILIIWDLFKEAFTEWVEGLWESIKETFDEFVTGIKTWFNEVVQPIIDKVKEFVQPIIDAIKSVIDSISNWFKEKIDWFAQTFPEAFAFIKNIIDKVMGVIDAIKEKLKFVTEAYNAAVEKLKSVGEGIKKFFGVKKKEEPAAEEAARLAKKYPAPPPPPKEKELVLDEKGRFVEKPAAAAPKPPPPAPPVEVPPKPAPIIVPPPVVTAPPPPPTAPTKEPPKPAPAPPPSAAAPVAKPPTAAETKPAKVSASSGKQAMIGAMNDAKIQDPTARAAIMAQVGHESGNFTTLSENLNYKAPTLMKLFPKKFSDSDDAQQVAAGGPQKVAERLYGGRMGNAPEGSGEGFLYRGRGFVQLTGKQNYTKFGYSSDPEQLTKPESAAESAIKYMMGYKGDWADIKKVTKFVNGGYIGLEDRQKHFEEYLNDPTITKIGAVASAPSGGGVASASTSLAAGQREQQKPTTPIVVNAPTTNNKVVNRTEVAQTAPPKDTATTLAARVA